MHPRTLFVVLFTLAAAWLAAAWFAAYLTREDHPLPNASI